MGRGERERERGGGEAFDSKETLPRPLSIPLSINTAPSPSTPSKQLASLVSLLLLLLSLALRTYVDQEQEAGERCTRHRRTRRCPTWSMCRGGTRRRAASMPACSPRAAASAATRPASAAWTASAAVADRSSRRRPTSTAHAADRSMAGGRRAYIYRSKKLRI